jgi:hypothetical protein
MSEPTPILEHVNNFSDEQYLTSTEKQHILYDWQRFIRSGFQKLFFTNHLHNFLHQYCAFTAHPNREGFWHTFFNAEIFALRALTGQFGGNRLSVEYHTAAWLDGPGGDLKAAMCQEMSQVYDALTQVLDDLEAKYRQMIQVWEEFALANAPRLDLSHLALPPSYQISENTRNLLAFAIQIALKPPRLRALQLQFPPPLLQPGYANASYAEA